MSSVETPSPRTLLQTVFGLSEFRSGQEAVINALLAGRSALALFPTGGGKSLCYQLPALALDGLTVVISPLIALMKDQVDALRAKNIPAARLDSSVPYEDVREIYDGLHNRTLKLLYIAPERLSNERFLERLRRQRIALLAVDEAHCISEWGHNFRPDYLKIAQQARDLAVQRVLALTATATPAVARDICQAFGIAPEDHVQTGFHRPNLTLGITPCTAQQRPDILIERLRSQPPGATIVYVTLQKTAEDIAALLVRNGFRARAYHAGLKDETRTEIQEAFMRGNTDIIAATIAFGMGIDKADIRAIYHYNLPKTLENYVQEIGRAGRDGNPSTCELLTCADDCTTLANFTYGDTPAPEHLRALIAYLLDQGDVFDISQYDLSVQFDIRPLVVATALTYLELHGAIEATGPFYSGYKYRFNRPEKAILDGFDANRRAFLQSLFASAKSGRIWHHLEPEKSAEALGEPRARIVAALTYLEEQGDLEVEVSGLRHGYRRIGQPDVPGLSNTLADAFARREQQDIDRLARVVAFAEHGACHTRHLLAYFGESLERDCGHCSGCAHPGARNLPRTPVRPLGNLHADIIAHIRAEQHDALLHPRQLARFLCGLTSPGASRARLSQHPRFGSLADFPFPDVLNFLEE